MDLISDIQKALDYIENHLTEKLDYAEISKQACLSSYNFQRIFGILSGYTLGEYIRNRRLALAGNELSSKKIKVIDAAIKYGYNSSDSFTKAFVKFHGITPSAAREPGAKLRSFPCLSIKLFLQGGNFMDYKIVSKPEISLVGHKSVCTGSPTNAEIKYRETYVHWITSRTEQKIMKAIRNEPDVFYDIYSNFSDEGFNHYIAVETDTINIDKGLEAITVPECLYAVFETSRQDSPEDEWLTLMRRIVTEWLPNSEYLLANHPQINKIHMNPDFSNRYMEIWIPIENK